MKDFNGSIMEKSKVIVDSELMFPMHVTGTTECMTS